MQIVHIQAVDFSIATSATQGTATLSGFTTLGKMAVFATWSTGYTAAKLMEGTCFCDIYLSSTTQLVADRDFADTTRGCNIRAYVVEFGADTNVYKGTFTMAATVTQHAGVAIGGTVTTANSFVWEYHKCTNNSNASQDWVVHNAAVAPTFATTSTLNFTRNNGGTAMSGHWYVVESSTLSVQHENFDADAAGLTFTDTLTTQVDLDHSFIMASSRSNAGNYTSENLFDARLNDTDADGDADQIIFEKGDTTQHAFNFNYQVITDSNLQVYQGTQVNTTATGSVDLPGAATVDLTRSICKSGLGVSPSAAHGLWASGDGSGHFMELWLSDENTVNWETTRAPTTNPQYSWEVIQFPLESTTQRRVFIIS